jgi:hypothetical protein
MVASIGQSLSIQSAARLTSAGSDYVTAHTNTVAGAAAIGTGAAMRSPAAFMAARGSRWLIHAAKSTRQPLANRSRAI